MSMRIKPIASPGDSIDSIVYAGSNDKSNVFYFTSSRHLGGDSLAKGTTYVCESTGGLQMETHHVAYTWYWGPIAEGAD